MTDPDPDQNPRRLPRTPALHVQLSGTDGNRIELDGIDITPALGGITIHAAAGNQYPTVTLTFAAAIVNLDAAAAHPIAQLTQAAARNAILDAIAEAKADTEFEDRVYGAVSFHSAGLIELTLAELAAQTETTAP